MVGKELAHILKTILTHIFKMWAISIFFKLTTQKLCERDIDTAV